MDAARRRVAAGFAVGRVALRMSDVYDAGVPVAAERNDRQASADHRARLELGVVPTTTAPAVARSVADSARRGRRASTTQRHGCGRCPQPVSMSTDRTRRLRAGYPILKA